jgi:hypothetical protein
LGAEKDARRKREAQKRGDERGLGSRVHGWSVPAPPRPVSC